MKLIERVDEINFRKLTEGSREDLFRSFMSLVKTNDGRFKSDKQAAFLTSQAENGEFFFRQRLSFGTSSHSQRQIEWTITLDAEGVSRVVKRTNSKGEELYFERGNRDTLAAKAAATSSRQRDVVKQEMQRTITAWEGELAELQQEITAANAALADPSQASSHKFIVKLLPGIEAKAAELTELIAREQSKLNAMS